FPTPLHPPVARSAPAGTHVEYLAAGIGRFARQQVGLYRVFDIREVAGLFAVAENDWLRLFQKRCAKFRQYPGIWRTGILSRPENIEVAQRDVLEAVATPEGLRIEFAHELRHSVRRNWLRLHRLNLRQC